ncbi:chitinase C precursor [mine drainage metagenome]|uniref:Chitinase C n=1 Tax=mine drainage metagenome TaxID=410659 RepID=A0A1J5SXF0_9ZZZZ
MSHSRLLLLVASVLAFAACTPAGSARTKIVGYWPSWTGDPATIEYRCLTHVMYAFALPEDRGDGTLRPLRNPEVLDRIVAAAHARGVHVLLSVGGWQDGRSPGFDRLAATPGTRARFVAALLALVKAHRLDGIDIDWEYPKGGDNPAHYAALMSELGAALHARGLLLTAAVPALGGDGDSIPSGVFSCVDFLNLMAYDGGEGAAHSPIKLAEDSLAYWRSRGLPKEKAVLGVPFYGRPGYVGYARIVESGADPEKDEFHDIHYNGLRMVRAKTRLALAQGGGVMIWELSQDLPGSRSLLRAIYSEAEQDRN